MLKIADKNNKVIVNIMEHIIVMRLEIENIVTNSINNYKRTTRFSKKQKQESAHENLVNVFMNMITTLCHVFMNDKTIDKLANALPIP